MQFFFFLLCISCVCCASGLVGALCSIHATRWTVNTMLREQVSQKVQVPQVVNTTVSSGSGYTDELMRQQQLSDAGQVAYYQHFDIQALA